MSKTHSEQLGSSRLVIITGLSGSGMSSATNAFEDLGFFCVDNLPLTLLSTFARLLVRNDEGVAAIEKGALVVDIRERHFLGEFPREIKKVERRGLEPYIVFFEASDDALQRRFSETRRPHPAESGKGLLHAISSEREAMQSIRSMSDLIVDTSEHTVHTLRRLIINTFGGKTGPGPLRVQFVSFGHKYGNPRDLDLMFDVRHLPNPYFDRSLRELTGEDGRIVKFLKSHGEVGETVDRFESLLAYLLPLYQREGKSYLMIGIGCTGGKHRSVMVANELAARLQGENFEISVAHRDMQK